MRPAPLPLFVLAGALCSHGCDESSGPRTGPDAAASDRPAPPDELVGPRLDAGPPRSFGAGFTDLTAPLERDAPFVIPAASHDMFSTDELSPLVGDLDGDGRDELVISHWPTDDSIVRGLPAPFAVYRYDRATRQFARVVGARLPEMPPLAGVLDLDGDGRDDLLALERSRAIAWGGSAGFSAPGPLDAQPADWMKSSRIQAYFLDDLDDDGWLDLLVATDCCRTPCTDLHALLRTGPRTFHERPDLLAISQVSKPYAAFSARFAPGERVLMSIGWSCVDPNGAPVFYRSVAPDPAGFLRFAAFDPTPARAFFRGEQLGFPTLAFNSPMAACADDLDDDGRLDLAVSLNPIHQLFRGTGRWPFEDATPGSGVPTTRADSGRAMIPWSMAFVDLDRDTRLDWIVAHGNDQTAWSDPPERFIGPQFVGAYQGTGGFRFTDVTEALHLGRRGQWRTLTLEDWDDDGDADLAVGGQQELPRLYRNDVDNGAHGVVLRLRGTTSNHLGVGAWLTVWVDEAGAPLRRYVGGSSHPYVVHEPFVTVGLGDATRIARLRVSWPSGVVQELRDLAADRSHTIAEPPSLAITPSTRHAPADGRSAVTVLVTPRDLSGVLRADARVEVSLAGPGALAGPAIRGSEGWTARITAPTSPGTALVTVRIDGAALAVRPRLWWD